MKNEEYIKLCARKVAEHENSRIDNIQNNIDRDDVFCVWSCKTLQNSKCLMSAPCREAYYYEFIMNGDKEEIYMDVYKKVVNKPLDFSGKEKTKLVK